MAEGKFIRKEMRDVIPLIKSKRWKKPMFYLAIAMLVIAYIVFVTTDFGRKENNKDDNSQVNKSQEKIDQEEKNQEIKAVDGGTVRIAVSKFSKADPYKNKDKSMDQFFRLVYDSMFEYDSNYNLQGELAEKYSIANGGKTINISLKTNAMWHDGTRVTANDVAYTISHIKSNPDSPYFHFVKNIANTSASGNNINIELQTPNSLEIYNMIFPIITQRSVGANTILKDDKFGVIGNGMFKVIEYNKGKNILLQRSSGYYGAKPHIENINVLIYNDSTIRKNMFIAKEIDLIESSYYELKKYEYDVFRFSKYQDRKFDFIAFNTNKAPFDQSTNRRAIAKILDIEKMANDAYKEEVNLSLFPINKGSVFNILNNQPYEETAIKKTKLIGTVPNSIKIILDKSDPMRNRMAYLIKSQLSVAGLNSTVVELSSEEMKPAVSEGNFDIALFSYDAPINKDIMKLNKLRPELFKYEKEKVDALMHLVYTQSDPEFQKQNYKLVQEELMKYMSFLGIGFKNSYVVYNNRVHGELGSTAVEIYNGIEKLFIPNN